MIIPKDGNVAWHRTERGRGQGRVGERISRTGTRFCAAKAIGESRLSRHAARLRIRTAPVSQNLAWFCSSVHNYATGRIPCSLSATALMEENKKLGKIPQGCGVASDLPAASAFVFQVAPIAIGSLKSMKEPGHPVKQAPTALFPSNPSFPARRSPSVIKMGIFDRQKYDFFLFIAFPLTPERGVW